VANEIQNIRLAALIIADEAVVTPLVLGRSLTELQIARVVSTGARHVVCLVRQVSSQILAVADNLRANGLTIDIVRSVADAADAIHPDEAVFLVASQVLVSGKTLGELVSSGPPSLLCVDNDAATSQFEIIDAATRWTGYALLDGATLRSVANMVGDWDAASTLLRQLVQENARRIVLNQAQVADAMLNIRNTAEATQAGRKLLDEDGDHRQSLGEYWLARPVSRFLARLAGELGLKSQIIEFSAIGAAIVAALIGLTGWLGVALLILLTAYFARSTAVLLAAALGEIHLRGIVFRSVMTSAAVVIVGACSISFASRTGQWGCLLLGGLLIGTQTLIAQCRPSPRSFSRWQADPLSSIALLFLGVISTIPVAGLFLAAAHTVASYLLLNHRTTNVVFDEE
jgi:hypothetical protein